MYAHNTSKNNLNEWNILKVIITQYSLSVCSIVHAAKCVLVLCGTDAANKDSIIISRNP